MRSIPDMPAGLTPALLTELLHEHGALAGDAVVCDVAMEQVGDGTGMMAELSKLLLSYEGQTDAPSSLIAKYASQNATNREVAQQFNLYERETRFASELDPQTSARTPQTFFSGVDEDRFLILMQDMTDYQVGSQVEGADLRQTELAIDELAKLHAAFWDRTAELDWIPAAADSYHAAALQAMAVDGVGNLADRFGDFLADEMKQCGGEFQAAIPEMQQWLVEEPTTLVHGDYRMENLLYGCQPDHHPLAILDWQGPLRARGMMDVALFLGHSTRTDVRREHEQTLLQRYQQGLEQQGIEPRDFSALWEEYRRTVMYNWIYVVSVAGGLDTSNEKAFAWMSQMVARQSAISKDLEVFELMPGGSGS